MMNHIDQRKEKLKDIYNIIIANLETPDLNKSIGLYDGEFGTILFLCNYIEFDDVNLDSIENFISNSVNKITANIGQYSFSCGLSGILYLVEYLQLNNIIEIEIEVEIRDFLEKHLKDSLKEQMSLKNYDFLHGVIGIALYFHKRKNFEIVYKVIDYFETTASIDHSNKTIYWPTTFLTNDDETINISLSHGISSILRFLCILQSSGNYKKNLSNLIYGAVNFLYSQGWSAEMYGSYFPSRSKNEKIHSRLSWCYGDLGIALSIWNAGNILKINKWIDDSLNILLSSTNRVSYLSTRIGEAGICHGSSGVAMIFYRMYLNTGDFRFCKAADYWVQQTLDFSIFEDGLSGYKSRVGNNWGKDYCLLTGISGIGLTLISNIKRDNQIWDEFFLISP